jgi:hypothetical protein
MLQSICVEADGSSAGHEILPPFSSKSNVHCRIMTGRDEEPV